jgi:hypothetical protein
LEHNDPNGLGSGVYDDVAMLTTPCYLKNSGFEDGLSSWVSSGAGNYVETWDDIQTYCEGFTGWDDQCAVVGYGQSSVSSLKQTLDGNGNVAVALEANMVYTLLVQVGRPNGYSNEYGFEIALEVFDGNTIVLDSTGYGDVDRIDPNGWDVIMCEYHCEPGDPLIGMDLVVALYHDDALGRGSGIYDQVLLRVDANPEPGTLAILGTGATAIIFRRRRRRKQE